MEEKRDFFENFVKKHENFFKQEEADENFFKQESKKHENFFNESEADEEFFKGVLNGGTTSPDSKASSGSVGAGLAQIDDSTVSEVVNSLKQKGIEVSPESVSQMIAQHANQDYTLQQIAAIVEVDCEMQHAKEQRSKREKYQGMSR